MLYNKTNHDEFNEKLEELSERRKIRYMGLLLLLIFPAILASKLIMDDFIEKKKTKTVFFSGVYDCIKSGNSSEKCIQAWEKSLPSIYRLHKYSPNLLNREKITQDFCQHHAFTTDVFDLYGKTINWSKYYLLPSYVKRENCLPGLKSKSHLPRITPYRYPDNNDTSFNKIIVNAWFEYGLELYQSNNPEKAIVTWQFITDKYIESGNLYLQVKLANALFNIGFIYYELNQPETAIFYWKKLVERYETSSHPEIISLVGKAWTNLGQVTMNLNSKSPGFRL
ncbi:tetratricopeptide repeat protein [Salmonella enterica]|nr:hypothetical protein [Salmonella enterica]EBH8913042.1 hypothetical protein [Salmonella enterica subsp. enterica serovar Teko]EDV9142545.1 tetratricopeptide repeat protein [Salmonella enterica subsp. enterica serovar Gombe]EDV9731981.1 tetratricopeptide repeat protein [Salmonella enterica subsp. enterica]EAQ2080488.1 tetratricopeptide repeat protein [Salmonella enterica]